MLTITDGDEVTTRILARYVGGSSPFKLSSTTPDLTVTFHSDPAGLVFGKGEGFIINYMGESLPRTNKQLMLKTSSVFVSQPDGEFLSRKTHQRAKLLHWLTCSFITRNTHCSLLWPKRASQCSGMSLCFVIIGHIGYINHDYFLKFLNLRPVNNGGFVFTQTWEWPGSAALMYGVCLHFVHIQ